MKKLLVLLLTILVGLSAFALASCGGNATGGQKSGTPQQSGTQQKSGTSEYSGTQQVTKKDITGVSYTNESYVYDGTTKSVTLTGETPEGVTVTYSGNTQTDAGVYNTTVTLSGTGYNTLVLNATLTIEKAELSGITLANQELTHDGGNHKPTLTGTLPAGVTAKYFFDEVEKSNVNAVGSYAVKVVLSGKNYKEMTLNCVYRIKLNLLGLAKTVVDTFGSVPDVWEFLPEGFNISNKVYNGTELNYTNFVNLSAIPKNGTGKQMNVIYGVTSKLTTALGYVNQVYAVMNTLQSLYQTYLNDNPDNYKTFSGSLGGFSFVLSLSDTEYSLRATFATIDVLIASNLSDQTYGARIQLSASNVLKYQISDNRLKIGLDILDVSATQLEFVRNDNEVFGYLYEYLVVADKTLTATSALVKVDANYTTVIGTKGDFVPTSDGRNCEVYNNADGSLVGTAVRETVKSVVFNTLWYNLTDVSGITSIRKLDEMNGSNADTIYINNAADTIHTKLVGLGGASGKTLSRRFDIEFKKLYFYTYDSGTNDYTSISMEIPMLFVQNENKNSLIEDFSAANSAYLGGSSISVNVTATEKEKVDYGYTTLLAAYDLIKEAVTYQDILDYLKIS